MKLYYKPGACSLATHIVLHELGEKFEIVQVDTKTKLTETGADYNKINPMGYVPALQLDSGEILTEGPAILQYLADQKPEKQLAPKCGTLERARLLSHLNFVATELHKAFTPFFTVDANEQDKVKAKVNVERKMDHFESELNNIQPFLLGENFTICDAYLFVVSNWTKPTGIGLDKWPKVKAYAANIATRASVQTAMRAEGLLK